MQAAFRIQRNRNTHVRRWYQFETLEQRNLLSITPLTAGFDVAAQREYFDAAEEGEAAHSLNESLRSAGYNGLGELLASLGSPSDFFQSIQTSSTSPVATDLDVPSNSDVVFGNDDRIRVTSTTSFPFRTIGRIESNFPGGTAIGTGAMIDAYHVLTAGHVVNDAGLGGWANSAQIAMGQNGTEKFYGVSDATYFRSYANWTVDRDSDHDWALITLDRRVGDYTGWMGREAYSDPGVYSGLGLNTAGYPGDLSVNAVDMYRAFGPADHATDNRVFYAGTLDTFGGQSGSPMWRYDSAADTRWISVIHTTGSATFNGGTRLNTEKFDRLNTWTAEDNSVRPPTDRPDLVDYDAWFQTAFGYFTPGTVSPGQPLSVRSVVRNNGTATAGAFNVSFYASTNDIISAGDSLLGTVSVSALNPFNWTDVVWTGTMPNIPAGNYRVGWIIDSANSQTEFLEGNNTGIVAGAFLTVGSAVSDVGDTLASAPSVPIGPGPSSGSFVNAIGNGPFGNLDVDIYRFTAAPGSRITAETFLPSGGVAMDTYLRIFDANGNPLIADDDAGAGNYSLISSFLLTTGGTYYAGVSGFQNTAYNPATGGSGIVGSLGDFGLSLTLTAPPANGSISGQVFNDLDGDGTRQGSEPLLTNWQVYIDANADGALSSGESVVTTNSSGQYTIPNLAPGTYQVREVVQSGWQQTSPQEPSSNFQVEVVFPDSTLTPSQRAIFSTAAARWSQVIIGDVPDVMTSGGLVDDLRIEATGPAIDGPGNILGQAGPTLLRSGSSLPVTGIMQFDSADLAQLEANGLLLDVILHEMGHVLGIGTIWNLKGLLTGAGGSDPRFTGAQATTQYNSIFGTSASSVPVENTGGGGTRDSHWREATFANELMTGFIGGGINPLSRVTAGSLEDLGYQVNLAAADPYTPPSVRSSAQAPLAGRLVALPVQPVFVTPLAGQLASLTGTHIITIGAGENRTGVNFGNQQLQSEIDVTGSGLAIPDGDNSPLAADGTDFGSTNVSGGTITRTFSIQNSGGGTLSIAGVQISGTHSADFSVVTPPAASVAPGGSTTFQVRFDPSAAGARTARITINNNDADEAAYDFAITGTGTSNPNNETLIFQDGVSPRPGDPAYAGTRDTYIKSDATSTNFGTTNPIALNSSTDQAMLIRWDLSSIAPGATVSSAQLSLTVSEKSAITFTLYELTKDWTETQATWALAKTGSAWQSPGAQGASDYVGAKPLGTITANATGAAVIDLNADGRAVVQKWINTPSATFGFIVQNYAASTNDVLQIRPREASTSNRPKLTITLGGSGPTTPSVSIGNRSASEGNAGTTPFVFTVNLSSASALPVSVAYSTTGGTATANVDYQLASGLVSFAPGETSKTITVLVNGDTDVESNETFNVTLSTPTNATLGIATGVGTIQNDDSSGGSTTIVFQDGVAPRAGDPAYAGTRDTYIKSDAASANFGTTNPIALNGSADQAMLIRWDLSSVTPGTTVSAAQISLTVSDKSAITFTLYELTKDWTETQATWALAKTGTPWQSPGAQGTGDYVGTKPLGTITATGTGTATIALNADGLAVVQKWINTPGTNFGFIVQNYASSTNDALEIRPREASTSNRPKLALTLGGGGGPTTPSVSISNRSASEGNAGTTPFVFTISLSGPSASQVTVAYSTGGGTATANVDYQPASGVVVVFAPGETSKAITILVNGDTGVESNETFNVTLSTPTNATLGTATGIGTIQNDDSSGGSTTIVFQDGVAPRAGDPLYGGTRDTYIKSDASSTNFGTANPLALNGSTDQALLIRWDLSSVAPGTTVSAAQIALTVSDKSAITFTLYELTKDWVETQATWALAKTGTPWQSPGAQGSSDFVGAKPLGTITATGTGAATIALNADGLAVVQKWINTPGTNFGFIVQNYASSTNDVLQIRPRKASTSNRPKLSLTLAAAVASAEPIAAPLAQTAPSSQSKVSAVDAVMAASQQYASAKPVALAGSGAKSPLVVRGDTSSPAGKNARLAEPAGNQLAACGPVAAKASTLAATDAAFSENGDGLGRPFRTLFS